MKRVRRIWKKTAVALFAAISLFFCFGNTSGAASEPIKIVFSTFWPTSYEYVWLPVKHFAEKVEKESQGRIKFELCHSKQLYGAMEEFGALERGDIDMASPTDIYHTGIIPELGISSLPFLFRDSESLQKMLDQGLWELGIRQKLLEHDIVVLGIAAGEPYQIYSKNVQVFSPEDMKGKKWGVSGATHSKAVELLGGIPDVMSSGKLHTAFREGRIDGCTRPFLTGRGRHLYEVADHLTVTNFACYSTFLGMNRKKWDQLPEDLQDIMKKAASERNQEQLRRIGSYVGESIAFFKAKGVRVHISTSEEADRFRKAMSPVYEWWGGEVPDVRRYINFVFRKMAKQK